ncbi:hypothetical protein AVEN_77973-1 [Araneus ventricosus]|uniref:Uncharacterized protein n=1 Tax=Araneus ventricosus TaxID=182803 RepID=A0A4Y2MAX0_ARAVE|nr:hypothetical protein AVEN_101553-1 [Araneus ventricosus]GBN22856.1 hypothetical protein AVEN_102831-1 [Araneus ventricosus]GBN22922.1 hypothetical protein AVEN_55573-1 [Araneus ventricosus]GBN22931.1 hypothetical protein AVEN_77973-1 [Araneus ventricosus]
MDWMFGIPNSSKSDWNGLMLLLRFLCEGSEEAKLLPRLEPRDEASKLGNSPFVGGEEWVATEMSGIQSSSWDKWHSLAFSWMPNFIPPLPLHWVNAEIRRGVNIWDEVWGRGDGNKVGRRENKNKLTVGKRIEPKTNRRKR